jgi:hypothetical protein
MKRNIILSIILTAIIACIGCVDTSVDTEDLAGPDVGDVLPSPNTPQLKEPALIEVDEDGAPIAIDPQTEFERGKYIGWIAEVYDLDTNIQTLVCEQYAPGAIDVAFDTITISLPATTEVSTSYASVGIDNAHIPVPASAGFWTFVWYVVDEDGHESDEVSTVIEVF